MPSQMLGQQVNQVAWLKSLLERHEGPLLRYATRLSGSEETARDVVQDTFVRLCQQPREKVAGREAEWLFTVCRNRALDVLRKESRMHANDAALAVTASADPSPGMVAEGKETKSRLLQLLDTLPPNQREVVRLKFQNGCSYKEISAITQHSVSNVGYMLHVALKTLRSQLQTQPGLAPQA